MNIPAGARGSEQRVPTLSLLAGLSPSIGVSEILLSVIFLNKIGFEEATLYLVANNENKIELRSSDK